MSDGTVILAVVVIVVVLIAAISAAPNPDSGRRVHHEIDGIKVYEDGCDFCDPGKRILCLRTIDHGDYHTARYCPICGKPMPDFPDDTKPPEEQA